MNDTKLTLPDLGWSAFYQSQLSIEEVEEQRPLRVTEVHRNSLETMGVDGPLRVPVNRMMVEHGMAVGDWILTERDSVQAERVLERKSLIKRGSAGIEAAWSRTSLLPPGSSVLTLTLALDSLEGDYPLLAVAMGGSIIQTASFTLTVQAHQIYLPLVLRVY